MHALAHLLVACCVLAAVVSAAPHAAVQGNKVERQGDVSIWVFGVVTGVVCGKSCSSVFLVLRSTSMIRNYYASALQAAVKPYHRGLWLIHAAHVRKKHTE